MCILALIKGFKSQLSEIFKPFFELSFFPEYQICKTMDEFKLKFKPLGFKVIHNKSKGIKTVKLDYIYNDVVYQIRKDFKDNLGINFQVQDLNNILIIFGGVKKIKEYTEFQILENIRDVKI